MTADPVGNIQAIEKLIPRNAHVMQAVPGILRGAALLQLLQSVHPGVGQNVNVKA